MAATSAIRDAIEMEIVLRLAPDSGIQREDLEGGAIDLERLLDEQTLDTAGGVSASANFTTGEIEIDAVLSGVTMGDLYLHLTRLVMQIERCRETLSLPPMTLRSARTALGSVCND